MPLTIQRTATVFLLWQDADVKALFEELSGKGWLCTLTLAGEWQVALQHSASRQLVTAPTSSVVVADPVGVFAQTVEEFNADNPAYQIEVGS